MRVHGGNVTGVARFELLAGIGADVNSMGWGFLAQAMATWAHKMSSRVPKKQPAMPAGDELPMLTRQS